MTVKREQPSNLKPLRLGGALLMAGVLIAGVLLGALEGMAVVQQLYLFVGGSLGLLLALWALNLSRLSVAAKAVSSSGLMLLFLAVMDGFFPAQGSMWLVLIPVVWVAIDGYQRELWLVLILATLCLVYLWLSTKSVGADGVSELLLPLLVVVLAALYTQAKFHKLRDSVFGSDRSAGLDELTGLLSMRTFLIAHGKAHAQAAEHEGRYALIMIDIDGLRSCNDNYDYAMGDRTILAVADAIRRSMRSGDFAARYGGDEFILYLADANDAIAQEIANTIMQNVYNTTLSSGHKTHRINVHTGMAIYPDSGKSCAEMMSFANQAMYRDKDFRRRTKPSTDSDEGRRQAGVTW